MKELSKTGALIVGIILGILIGVAVTGFFLG